MNFTKFRQFWTRKRLIWGGIILIVVLLIGWNVFGRGKNTGNITTEVVKSQNIEQTVLSTGQVVSNTDLNLSFQGTGIVRQVIVQEGQSVQAGQTLAVLDQGAANAALTSAEGSLQEAQANYDELAGGSTSADVQVSQAAVDAAQTTLDNANQAYTQTVSQQKTLVANADSAMLNAGLAAIPSGGDTSTGNVTISGTYTGTAQGVDTITMVGSGATFNLQGLDTDYERITRGVALPLGTHGLYVTFGTAGTFNPGDTWTVSIPNTQSSTYLAAANAYQSSLQTQTQAVQNAQAAINNAQSSLEQAQAALALKKAPAGTSNLEAAQAQVTSAQGQVDAAQVTLNNTILRAPSKGTVTEVDTKVGEEASALQEVMILQDVGDLHAESDVSEADIASLGVGQSVDYTFDALGPDHHVSGSVLTINPASTVISGIVNYKVTASIDDITGVKPGMTANMTILAAQKSNVLAISANAIINQNGNEYVRVVDDPKTDTYHQVQVQTGLNADGGLVEITGGLSAGQEIIDTIQ